MATQNLGRVKIVWQGEYNSATAYVIDDAVTYEGSSYVCIKAAANKVPTNTEYWEVIAQKGVDGEVTQAQLDAAVATLFPRSEQAVLGAKQLFKPVPITVNGVSVTVNSDGSVNASGNPEQTTSSVRIFSPSVLLKKGSYRATLISGTNLPSDAILRIATVIDGNWSTIATSEIGADAVFTLNDDVTPLGITIGMTVTSGTAINMSNIKVLITLASDTDRTFVPPAMTNRELTEQLNAIFAESLNDGTTFNIPYKRKSDGRNTSGLIVMSGGLYHYFLRPTDQSNTVDVNKILDVNSSRSATGSFANDILTITFNATVPGGITLLTGNRA